MQKTYYYTLNNGVRVIHRTTESAVSYVGVMIGAGTRHEAEKENGLAHYIEHCVFKGTEHYSSRQIIEQIEGVGGEINAYTTKEETTYYTAILSNHISKALHLLSEMVLHPTFPKEETDKELQVIYDEIESYNDSPSELIYDDFENIVFEGQSLAMPILGTRKTLRYITRAKALRFMSDQYRPDKMVVFCLSNQSEAHIRHEVEKYFEESSLHSANTTEVVALKSADTTYQPRQASYHKHTHQAHVMIGRTSYPLGHEKQLAMYLLNNILGGGSMSSRLNLSLREKQGLVYTVESTYTPLSDTGYWCIYFASEPQNKEKCLHLIYKELQALCEKPLSQSALERAKRQLRGQMAISAENQENNALGMAKQMLYFGQAPTWEDTMEKIDQLTADELQQVAKEMYQRETLSVLEYA